MIEWLWDTPAMMIGLMVLSMAMLFGAALIGLWLVNVAAEERKKVQG